MQARQQPESDVLRNPAFILLCLPVELEGADGAESGEDGVEDYQIHVVPEVDPDAHEEGEVREDQWGVYVVEGFGCLVSDQIPDLREGDTGWEENAAVRWNKTKRADLQQGRNR